MYLMKALFIVMFSLHSVESNREPMYDVPSKVYYVPPLPKTI